MTKYHYFLLTGTVTFQENSLVGEPENPTDTLVLNAVLISNSTTVTVRELTRAQQGLQKQLYVKTDNKNLRVLDVIILNMSYMGQMTEEEFHGKK